MSIPSDHAINSAVNIVADEIFKIWDRVKSEKGIRAKLTALVKVVPAAVEKVEDVAKRYGLKGWDKRTVAVRAILIHAPLPWWVPRPLLVLALELAIDAVVEAINRRLKKP